MKRFELEKWLGVVQKYGVTFAHVAPPISILAFLTLWDVVVLLAKDPIVDKYDLSSLRIINSSSAPLKEDLLLATYKRLGIPVKQGKELILLRWSVGYGMTETAPMVEPISSRANVVYHPIMGGLETFW